MFSYISFRFCCNKIINSFKLYDLFMVLKTINKIKQTI